MDRMKTEARTLEAMVKLYCRMAHGQKTPCPDCADLLAYALKRLDHCSQAPDKPACARCRVPCYTPVRKQAIRQVMRTVGPWMALYHPWLAARHLLRI